MPLRFLLFRNYLNQLKYFPFDCNFFFWHLEPFASCYITFSLSVYSKLYTNFLPSWIAQKGLSRDEIQSRVMGLNNNNLLFEWSMLSSKDMMVSHASSTKGFRVPFYTSASHHSCLEQRKQFDGWKLNPPNLTSTWFTNNNTMPSIIQQHSLGCSWQFLHVATKPETCQTVGVWQISVCENRQQ